MSSKKFAFTAGSTMLLLGLFALIPALTVYNNQTLPALKLSASYGYFLGIFPMNILNKLALIFLGIAGIACSNARASDGHALSPSTLWSRVLFYAMAALAVLGSFKATNTFGGYWPLFGNEIWFHALFAAMGGFYGHIAHHKDKAQGSTGVSWSRT